MNQFMSNLISVRVFHHIVLKYDHENAEMQKRQFYDVTLRYSICSEHFGGLIIILRTESFVDGHIQRTNLKTIFIQILRYIFTFHIHT